MTPISTSHNSFYVFFHFVLSYNMICEAKNLLCYGPNFDPGSKFEANRQQVFDVLVNSAPANRFYNTSFGDDPDKVFGLALCRTDTSEADCKNCIYSLTTRYSNYSENKTSCTAWFDHCMVRHSDRYFFGVVNTSYGICRHDSKIIDNGLTTSVTTLMNKLSSAAANSSQLFAVGQVKLSTDGQTMLYGLAECTRDLSKDDCYRCLTNNTNGLLTTDCNQGMRGTRILAENCCLWYNDTLFFDKNFLNDNTTTNGSGDSGGKNIRTIIVTVSCVAGIVIIFTFIFCLWKRTAKASSSGRESDYVPEVPIITEDNEIRPDLTRTYSIEELKKATENFSSSKRLGQGGYGEVYEGIIDGNVIAVKRLFRAPKEDEQKQKKLISLVANIEHPNILKLLGYCFEEDQYLFVYEYMPEGSLDRHLKDGASRQNLNWLRRFKIIKGIAQGLLYFHHGLERNIIHVDLKLANILLSGQLTAKIADFDLLRAFEIDQTHQSTDNGYGTPGYMAPEVNLMAPRKSYSVKSDVYSFGIMVLEIVTGERIQIFKRDPHPNLTSFVWYHWNRKSLQEVIDPNLDFENKSTFEQIVRCIHIGLLCIQHVAAKRPGMPKVLDMLNSKYPLQAPSIPGFLQGSLSRSNKSGFLNMFFNS